MWRQNMAVAFFRDYKNQNEQLAVASVLIRKSKHCRKIVSSNLKQYFNVLMYDVHKVVAGNRLR
jgi:hypothetical protein